MRGGEPAPQDRLKSELPPATEFPIEGTGKIPGKGVTIKRRPYAAPVPNGTIRQRRRGSKVDADADYCGVADALKKYPGELGITEQDVVGPLQAQRMRVRQMRDQRVVNC